MIVTLPSSIPISGPSDQFGRRPGRATPLGGEHPVDRPHGGLGETITGHRLEAEGAVPTVAVEHVAKEEEGDLAGAGLEATRPLGDAEVYETRQRRHETVS